MTLYLPFKPSGTSGLRNEYYIKPEVYHALNLYMSLGFKVGAVYIGKDYVLKGVEVWTPIGPFSYPLWAMLDNS